MKLVHCSYHKCLTAYFTTVLSQLYNRTLRFSRGYRHFNSLVDDFYRESDAYKVASVNNHALDLTRLPSDVRITRFIRDPRDLVVSGYFYHRRGAEEWSTIVSPSPQDWEVVNGSIPKGMNEGVSLSSYLQTVSEEDGLMAEIDFRKRHLESMAMWPIDDPRIKLFRYEEIIGNEADVFADIFSFYGVSWPERRVASRLADRFAAGREASDASHIRNATPGQWERYFTPAVHDHFDRSYAGILDLYGYR